MKDLLTRALDAHGGLSRWRDQRMDYTVEVVGDMVAGATAQYCFDHTPFGGIVFRPSAGQSAALRRVQCYRVRRAHCYK